MLLFFASHKCHDVSAHLQKTCLDTIRLVKMLIKHQMWVCSKIPFLYCRLLWYQYSQSQYSYDVLCTCYWYNLVVTCYAIKGKLYPEIHCICLFCNICDVFSDSVANLLFDAVF